LKYFVLFAERRFDTDYILLLKQTAAVLITVAALVCDIKSFRIPNKLLAVGAGIAALILAAEGIAGGNVLCDICRGIAVLVVLFVVYCIGGIGAGDVKLLAVLGLLLGSKTAQVIVAAFIAAAVLGVAGMLFKNVERRKVRVLEGYQLSLHVLHFSVAIFIGEIVVLYVPSVSSVPAQIASSAARISCDLLNLMYRV
jgi:Flp pilus assembly protein protease CpaA